MTISLMISCSSTEERRIEEYQTRGRNQQDLLRTRRQETGKEERTVKSIWGRLQGLIIASLIVIHCVWKKLMLKCKRFWGNSWGHQPKMKTNVIISLFKFCFYKNMAIMEIFFGNTSFPLECFVLWYCGIGWPLHPPSLCHIRLPECLVKSQYVLISFPISIFWYSFYTLYFFLKSFSLTTRCKEIVQKYQ